MLSVIYSLFFFLHPVHVSVTEVNYNEKDKALQITSRIFVDDLELAIREKRKEPDLDILEPGAGLKTDQLVGPYLSEHFKVKIDGKPVKFNFLASEKEDYALVCYIEIPGIKKMKTFEITDDVIMEIHDDQSNLVHITYKSPVKSVRLTRDKPFEVFTFDTK